MYEMIPAIIGGTFMLVVLVIGAIRASRPGPRATLDADERMAIDTHHTITH